MYGYMYNSRLPALSYNENQLNAGRQWGMPDLQPSGLNGNFIFSQPLPMNMHPESNKYTGIVPSPMSSMNYLNPAASKYVGELKMPEVNDVRNDNIGGMVKNSHASYNTMSSTPYMPAGTSMNSINGCFVGTGSNNSITSMHNLANAGSTTSLNSNDSGMDSSTISNIGNEVKLIVNYLPSSMVNQDLYELFSTVGPVISCHIMRDLKTSNSFGYGFVDFESELVAEQAIKSLNGIAIGNKRLKVSYARPGGKSNKNTNLIITRLPHTMTDDQLEAMFAKYGVIVQKNILRNKLTGKSRGIAFVRFSKREEAHSALCALNNVIPEGSTQPISIRIAVNYGKLKEHFYRNKFGSSAHGTSQFMAAQSFNVINTFSKNLIPSGHTNYNNYYQYLVVFARTVLDLAWRGFPS